MKKQFISTLCLSISLLLFTQCEKPSEKNTNTPTTVAGTPQHSPENFAIVIHGGAGTITKSNMTDERRKAYQEKLQEALDTGYAILARGGNSLEAVQKTINIMEDSPLFNAGKGAVLNSLGKNELDASIMDGKTLNTGAVAGVSGIRNPINAARLVMDSTKHVMLGGKGAEDFARLHGLTFEDASYFITEDRMRQLKRAQDKEKGIETHSVSLNDRLDEGKFGTVGAVAIDKNGTIAAGTSTGGMTNKKYGRIGDTPIIGAGTYANNLTCGISCTGTGEYFIRTLAAHEASNLIQYKKLPLKDALDNVIKQIGDLGGSGGMIGLDKEANIAWSFNTEGMYRGFKKSDHTQSIEFYND
ncbi:isoaspartyl peptidase/L-asparaginase [Flavobacteriaceae bacterium F08102]|nr:isoaspartyl peptidase/L-asparaginase [Flavobacteriaceae bacterium F08102]